MRQLTPALSSMVLVCALSACDKDQAANQAAPAPAETAAPSAAPAAQEAPDAAPAAASADEELVYDPIDISKLDNQWWRQYAPGGG